MIRPSLVWLLLVWFVAGCQAPPPEAFVAGAGGIASSAVSVGANEVGEPCRFQATPATGGAAREAMLFCGDWEQPSGRVVELATTAGQGQLAGILTSGAWRSSIDQRFTCGGATPTSILEARPRS